MKATQRAVACRGRDGAASEYTPDLYLQMGTNKKKKYWKKTIWDIQIHGVDIGYASKYWSWAPGAKKPFHASVNQTSILKMDIQSKIEN